MKIQWNSDAAQEVLERLRRAQRGLDESMVQAHRIDSDVEEANADGEDEALTELAQRLAECRKRLSELIQQLSDFRDALIRADERFDDTERHIRSAVDNLETGRTAQVYADYRGSASWDSSAYAVMPDMRTQSIPLPDWLSQLTENAEVL